ncbi:MAG: VacJ family lipoprotein [Burkholderiaceae bacterium]
MTVVSMQLEMTTLRPAATPAQAKPQRAAVRSGSLPALAGVLLLTAGCATVTRPSETDPLESYNRSMFAFNETLDRAVLKPVATGYQMVVPELVRAGVGNVFDNMRDAWSFVNNVLQAKPTAAADSALRFGVNTVMGVGGLFDVAGEMRIPRHTEDFGQTLGYWGVRSGPYLVLPLLGPSTVRDTAALPIDLFVGDPVQYLDPLGLRLSLTALRIVDTRADLLSTSSLLSDIALDKYTFVRDAYLQLRRASIGTGDDSGRARIESGRAWVNDLTNRSGPARSGVASGEDAGKAIDYSQPVDGSGQAPDYTEPANEAGKAPDYTQPADDAGKAPDYTKP